MSQTDEAFVVGINDDKLKKKYFSELKTGKRQIKREFNDAKSKILDKYEKAIEAYQMHDELVNLGIFPFLQTYPPRLLGYKLKCCDPLLETGKPNFDFLIVKEANNKAILIFGEAKIDRDNFDSIAEEVLQKIEVVRANLETIRRTYLSLDTIIVHAEYVILIQGRYVDKMRSSLEKAFTEEKKGRINEGTRIIIWKADLNEGCLERFEPGYKNPYYQQMIHADGKLNSRLNRLERNDPNVLDLFPQSHIVRKLHTIIRVALSNKALRKMTFSTGDMRQILEQELGYIHPSRHGAIINEILDEGVEIGILEKLDPGTFRIAKAFSGKSLNAKAINKVWLNRRLDRELQTAIENFRSDLQKSIVEEFGARPRTPSLEKWFNP